MGNNSNSNQLRSIHPFNRDETPLFQRTDPDTISTIEHASPPFFSLVDFIKKDNTLDDKGTEQACALLHRITYQIKRTIKIDQILVDLVPSPDHSCSGFTTSIVPLLTSSNEQLINSTLSLLNELIFYGTPLARFDILNTGLFLVLPKAFYEQDIHLSPSPELFLMNIVDWLVFCLSKSSSRAICEERHISMESFHQTFIDKFFHPINPFLDFIFHNRRRITDCEDSHFFTNVLGEMIKSSPFLEEMTQFILSSSFALTFTDSLVFFEWNKAAKDFLWSVLESVKRWKEEETAVQKRSRQILVKLREEGFDDEIEFHIQCRGFDFTEMRNVVLGANLIDKFGGNLPFMDE
ncbi:hypothetical protein BLNAU_14445 [Blattamonas nauphoetae]|uniref:Uncharacterized protein n=1 Tax=Blattamonas nauphoetae TaxID=2049346 RepID=A0ABQ9XGV0_9EUKA|nr:hypothetical protein BLNAU_14445 [Blattamonas nauphoetae]